MSSRAAPARGEGRSGPIPAGPQEEFPRGGCAGRGAGRAGASVGPELTQADDGAVRGPARNTARPSPPTGGRGRLRPRCGRRPVHCRPLRSRPRRSGHQRPRGCLGPATTTEGPAEERTLTCRGSVGSGVLSAFAVPPLLDLARGTCVLHTGRFFGGRACRRAAPGQGRHGHRQSEQCPALHRLTVGAPAAAWRGLGPTPGPQPHTGGRPRPGPGVVLRGRTPQVGLGMHTPLVTAGGPGPGARG